MYARVHADCEKRVWEVGDGLDFTECPGQLIFLKRARSDFAIKSEAIILQVMYPKRLGVGKGHLFIDMIS